MTDPTYRMPGGSVVRFTTPWGAIWAGVFSFVAIWSVFGLLGAAIFSSAAPGGEMIAGSKGIGTGMGIWSIVLTMIAMFVGGRVTSHLGGVTNRGDGVICGMTMFGLAIISTLGIVVLSGVASSNGTAAAAPFIVSAFAAIGWFGFAALFLGWLGAIGGASSVRRVESQAVPVHEMRSAA
jgi:hypothetical protein